MIRFSLSLCTIILFAQCNSSSGDLKLPLKATVYETSSGTKTSTYYETIEYYQYLDSVSQQCELHTIGVTDSKELLHLMVWSYDGKTSLEALTQRGKKNLVFINNGIHPGEPDGIDASQLLLKRLISDKNYAELNKNTVLAIIPIYNVGGAINRNNGTRVNQNGPVAYGFRGNAHNFDLNRDFVKMDSKNAWALTRIFSKIDPDLFIDTHVSNGADYPYNITLLANHHNKFRSGLESFLHKTFTPSLYNTMANMGEKMVPYVNVHGSDPKSGITEFLDHPRYSNGFAAIHSCPAYTIETHMLKSYTVRTEATYKLLESFLAMSDSLGAELKSYRQQEKDWHNDTDSIPTVFELTQISDSIWFEGYVYESKYNTTFERDLMQYNRDLSYAEFIPHHKQYSISRQVPKPNVYYIQGGYHQVIDRLINNGIVGEFVRNDTTLNLVVHNIDSYETITKPFEGHYLHYNTKIRSQSMPVTLRKGDFVIYSDDNNQRLLAEYLDPVAPDSYFNWGFFDCILQQKEGYSTYVWQFEAAKMLETDVILKTEFELKKQNDKEFANSLQLQLYWLYQQSSHYEKAYKRLPVFMEY